jgi:Arc/MetJ family transcription regulator
MKTHIDLDELLLARVLKLGGFETKRAAVNEALAEYEKLLKRRKLLALRGKIEWRANLAELRAARR